ncbi:MAG: D-alanyl-D-alanine carboxypeptidase [Myxococcota bacterium]
MSLRARARHFVLRTTLRPTAANRSGRCDRREGNDRPARRAPQGRVGLGLLALVAACAPSAALAADLPADLPGEARRLVGAGQGVYVEAEDGTVLVAEAAARAVHPASVSKLATTLALLRSLGPDHRFETRFLARGPIRDGALEGGLAVRADGDPYFVDENAILVAHALHGLGLVRVRDDLVVEGRILFDWKPDALAPRLRRALEGGVPDEAWRAVRERTGGGGQAPRLAFGRGTTGRTGDAAPGETLLVTHRSQPLRFMLKALNGYSNNIFAPFAEAAGGIESVERRTRDVLPAAWREELRLGDGAGAHRANRMSPRVAVAILKTLAAELAPHGLDLADVMPVAGVDAGTLEKRLVGPDGQGIVVAKTGTYGDYGACALAGALRTRRHGLVYFAILNRGVPIVEGRRRQDAFVRVLMQALEARPWGYARDDAPAFTRAEVVTAATTSRPAP